MSVETAREACMDGLAAYLQGAIEGLSVRNEWPAANQQLKYPSVTLSSGRIPVRNEQPTLISKTAPDSNGQVIATECIGLIDFKIQLDLWCATKPQRNAVTTQLTDALNAQAADNTGRNNPAGLSLSLTSYYNEWVRYDIDGYNFVDDEQAAERQERRMKMDLLVNCRVIQQRKYFVIKKIQSSLGVGIKDSDTNSLENSEV